MCAAENEKGVTVDSGNLKFSSELVLGFSSGVQKFALERRLVSLGSDFSLSHTPGLVFLLPSVMSSPLHLSGLSPAGMHSCFRTLSRGDSWDRNGAWEVALCSSSLLSA